LTGFSPVNSSAVSVMTALRTAAEDRIPGKAWCIRVGEITPASGSSAQHGGVHDFRKFLRRKTDLPAQTRLILRNLAAKSISQEPSITGRAGREPATCRYARPGPLAQNQRGVLQSEIANTGKRDDASPPLRRRHPFLQQHPG